MFNINLFLTSHRVFFVCHVKQLVCARLLSSRHVERFASLTGRNSAFLFAKPPREHFPPLHGLQLAGRCARLTHSLVGTLQLPEPARGRAAADMHMHICASLATGFPRHKARGPAFGLLEVCENRRAIEPVRGSKLCSNGCFHTFLLMMN